MTLIWLTYDIAQETLIIGSKVTATESSEMIALEELHTAAMRDTSNLILNYLDAMRCHDALAGIEKWSIKSAVIEARLLNIMFDEQSPTFLAALELVNRIRHDSRAASIKHVKIVLDQQQSLPAHILEKVISHQFPQIDVTSTLAHQPAFGHTIISALLSWISLLVGIGFNGLGMFLSMLKRENWGQKRVVHISKETFVMYPGWQNDTKHSWRYLSQSSLDKQQPVTAFVSSNPISRRPPKTKPSEMNINVNYYRAWHPSDYFDMCVKLIRAWPDVWSRMDMVFDIMQLELRQKFKVSLKTAYFLSLALLRRMWVERSNFVGDGNIIFGHSPHLAPEIAFDLALQDRGFTTIHWLHGVPMSVLPYRCFSSIAVCKTMSDAEDMRRLKTYGRCEVIQVESVQVQPPVDDIRFDDSRTGTLIITNFIHPSSVYSNQQSLEYLYILLELIAKTATDHEAMLPLIWRPHPHSNDPKVRKLKPPAIEKARTLGYDINSAGTLAEQLDQARFLITTYSSSVIDILQSGFVPALFTLNPMEKIGLWSMIPDELKFDDQPSLVQALDYLQNRDYYAKTQRILVEKLNLNASAIPPVGYFAALTKT